MADPLERLVNLVALLLNAPRPMTLDEIADAMPGQYPDGDEARRGAFERDKRTLRAESVPLETAILAAPHAGATGYWIDRARYELPDLGLTDDERQALRAAMAAVHLGAGGDDEAGTKLGVDDDAASALVTAMLATLPDLPTLFDASTQRAPVTFRYRGELRTVDPYAIVHRDGFWYVIGHDHLRAAQRAFRVDRIEGGLSVGPPQAYDVPDDFDARSAIAADPKLLGESAPVVARVLVDGVRAAKVCREVGDEAVEERRPDGSVVVRVPATNRPAFRSWLLGLLDHAEVLDPPDVRADVVAWLRATAGVP